MMIITRHDTLLIHFNTPRIQIKEQQQQQKFFFKLSLMMMMMMMMVIIIIMIIYVFEKNEVSLHNMSTAET